jgi:uncharacterized protein (TIGR03085 family)
MTTPARVERTELCDLMLAVGPDAPTLCGDWTTRDLAAHLVVRERRPDAAIGIVAKPLAGYGEQVRRNAAERDYEELVEEVRSGPPMWSPTAITPVDRLVNTIEFFVHHEDVRRATPRWVPRRLDAELENDLWSAFRHGASLLARRSPAGLVLRPDGHSRLAVKHPGAGQPTVTASGPLGELVLFAYGRQAHSVVELDGPADAVEAVRAASFGI